jgi:predicted hotdog family 3-hydroxylacyl-ACP dehydratase
MLIERHELAMLIPHSGSMCLLDGVLEWNETRIRCQSCTHRDLDNPMRRFGQLHAVCGIEYVSQAMAAHAALGNSGKGHSRKGYLASVRNFSLSVARLDTVEGDLIIEADQIVAEDQRALYDFRISAQGQVLMTGRAAAVFDVAAP